MRAPGCRLPASMRLECAMHQARRSAQARPACCCGDAAIRTATSTRRSAYTSKQLGECYRQGGSRLRLGRCATRGQRSTRDGSESGRLGAWPPVLWEALQMELAVRIGADGRWTGGESRPRSPTSALARHTIVAQDRLADLSGPAARQHHGQARRLDAAAGAGRKAAHGPAASVSHAIAKTAGEVRNEPSQ